MDNEPEVIEASEPEIIKLQMEETRSALVDKLETLEQQVVDTVQGTTNAVTDTVDTVKEGVQEMMDTVKLTMQEAVDSVKETLDIRRQVDRHPWAMMGGSVALGYAIGYLLSRGESADRPAVAGWDSSRSARDTSWSPPPAPSYDPRAYEQRAAGNGPAAPAASAPPEKSWLSEVTNTFGAEIDQLKGLAIGAALGIVRDMVSRSAPPELGPQIANVVDNITTKLGGKPVQGPLLDFNACSTRGESHAERQPNYGTSSPVM